MTRDEMMVRAEGAVTKHAVAVANIHRGEGPLAAGPRTRAALLTAIGACLDWVPESACPPMDCPDCRWCQHCPKHAREGEEDSDEV